VTRTLFAKNGSDHDRWLAHSHRAHGLSDAFARIGLTALRAVRVWSHSHRAHGLSDAFARIGLTALMWAAIKGHTRVLELLIAAGADVGATDGNGCARQIQRPYARSSDALAIGRPHVGAG
jgi:hypothetical protein